MPQPAIPPAPETIIVDDDIDEISCDGGGGALGHPLVWYNLDSQDRAGCGYCDRAFVKKRAASGLDRR
jgi:uncharacterized Zn-finger protein